MGFCMTTAKSEPIDDPAFERDKIQLSIRIAKRYIKLGIAKDLSKPNVARPIGDGLYLLVLGKNILGKTTKKPTFVEYRSSLTGTTINAIGKRISDGQYVAAVNELDIWNNPAYTQPPYWIR